MDKELNSSTILGDLRKRGLTDGSTERMLGLMEDKEWGEKLQGMLSEKKANLIKALSDHSSDYAGEKEQSISSLNFAMALKVFIETQVDQSRFFGKPSKEEIMNFMVNSVMVLMETGVIEYRLLEPHELMSRKEEQEEVR